MNVLVADDNEGIASIIKTYLEDYEVEWAADATSALEVIEVSKPQVIVADLNIPPLKGFEFIERINIIKESWQYLIVLTGSAFDESSLDFLGVDSVYIKPCSMKTLTDEIRTRCDEHVG